VKLFFSCFCNSNSLHYVLLTVGIGPDSFYTTNDRYLQNRVLGLVATFYPLKLANVVFYDGSHAKIVADHFHMANGISSDASRK
jgi:arylesterase/paraoxonase